MAKQQTTISGNQSQPKSESPAMEGSGSVQLEDNPSAGGGSSIGDLDSELSGIEREAGGGHEPDFAQVQAEHAALSDREIILKGMVDKSHQIAARGGVWSVAVLNEEEADRLLDAAQNLGEVVASKAKTAAGVAVRSLWSRLFGK